MCSRCGNNRCKSCAPGKVEKVTKTYTLPVPGKPGAKGDRQVTVYRLSDSNSLIPPISNVVNPPGWSTSPMAPTEAQPYRWASEGYISADGTVLVQEWSTPVVDLDTDPFAPARAEDIFNI